jgi:hypothetical protein
MDWYDDELYFEFSWETAGTFDVRLRDTEYDIYIPLDTIEVEAGPVGSGSTVMAVPTTIAPFDAEATVITATLTDDYGNVAADRPVTLAFNTYEGLTEVASGTTDLNGQIVFTETWPYSEWLHVILLDNLFDSEFWTDTVITVGLGEMSPANSTATITPTAILANHMDAAVISATIRDANNQPIAGRAIQLRTDDYTVGGGYTDLNGQLTLTGMSRMMWW